MFQKGAAHIFVPIILFAAIAVALIVVVNTIDDPEDVKVTTVSTAVPEPPATPVPFQELTIPYLRNREYVSNLTELREYAENANYTSYLTSYDSDGLKVNGLLAIPKGEPPPGGHPAIVLVHGYIAPTIYRTTERYVDHVNYLASRGLVVFKIDLRGHGSSEGDPGGGYYSGDYVIDTLNAYSALQNSGFVNPEAVGLWGHSMSGNVVFRAFVAKQDIPAVVIWAGAVYTYEDMAEYRINDNSYRPPPEDSPARRRRQELSDTHGSFSNESEFWRQVVPTNYLADVKGAVQIHHALDDTVVNIGYSRNLVSILNSTNIKSELFEYPSGGHNMTGASFSQAMARTVGFFNQNLK